MLLKWIRIQDVDLDARRLLVRLPNKGKRERFAFFSEKTARYWNEWMSERDVHCGHDFVLYNDRGTPYTPETLANAFKRTLCKEFKGKQIHEVGLDKWSTHRLRHTMASSLVAAGADLATVMASGGWLDPDTMTGYAEVPVELARRGYDEAMRAVHEQKDAVPTTRTVSPEQLLDLWAAEESEHSASEHDSERCV